MYSVDVNSVIPLFPSLWSLFFVGCVVWPGLFLIFWSTLSLRYPPTLACGTAMRLVSCVHAIFECICAYIIMSTTYTDMFYKDCKLLDQCTAFCAIYWLYDVVAMYMVYCREKQQMHGSTFTTLKSFFKENPLVCFHHFLVLGGGVPLLLFYRFGKGAFQSACLQFTEMSTPFLNIRRIFIKHNFTDNILFRVNTAIAVALFFLTRIVLFPSLYLIYANCYQLTMWEAVTSMYLGCHIGMAGIIGLQITWFTNFIRAISKRRKPPSGQENGYQSGLNEQHHPNIGYDTKKSD